MKLATRFGVSYFWAVCCLAAAAFAQADEPATLRVMSFNIRYGTADDGENHWDKRHGIVLDVINSFNPDLLGTQEVLDFQADFLTAELKDFTLVGVGRDDGKRAGEYAALVYRTQRFKPLDSGNFWLSLHPDQPGSQSWDAALPRIATWARLRDLKTERDLMVLNTHFDHQGAQARLESARLIRKWLGEHAPDMPIVIIGDFNCDEASEPYRALVGEQHGQPALQDSYRAAHPTAKPDEATYHGFNGNRRGTRIDWILHSPHWQVAEAAINHSQQQDRYPSDHFPVTAVLRLRAEKHR